MEPLLTVAEAARLLGVATRTMRELAYQRRVACVKVGKLYRFRREHVEAYMRAHELPVIPERKLKAAG